MSSVILWEVNPWLRPMMVLGFHQQEGVTPIFRHRLSLSFLKVLLAKVSRGQAKIHKVEGHTLSLVGRSYKVWPVFPMTCDKKFSI